MRQTAAWLALTASVLVWPALAQDRSLGERRVALVVGNAAYKSSPLKNPGNDARAIAATLRRLNFEVIERQNVTREGFASAAREFGDRLKGASVGLFYFAGHGLQVRGRNFLVPVDADIAREDEVPYRSLDVNEILDKMDSARTPINLVLLDACRNNPFARSFKLSQVGLAQMDAPSGTLIAFATSPGSVAQDGDGDNGLYTSALLRHIGTEALPIEQMLKRVRVDVVRASNNSQVPWESSSLNRDFAFAQGATSSVAVPATAAAANAATELALDLAFWDAVKGSSNPADYRAYMEQYPQGRFAALARIRADSGRGAGASPVVAPSPALLPANAAGAPVRVVSPEALYVAVASAGRVTLHDAVTQSAIRTMVLDSTDRFVPDRAEFSPDGRWLAVGGARDGRPVQFVSAVSSGKLVWDKPATSAEFDKAKASVRMQLSSGGVELLDLR